MQSILGNNLGQKSELMCRLGTWSLGNQKSTSVMLSIKSRVSGY